MTGMARIAASRAESLTGVQIAAPLLGVVEGQQDLPRDDAVRGKFVRPGAGERDLSDRGGGLAVLELQFAARQAGDRAAERDRSRGDDQNVGVAPVERDDVGDQCLEPILLQNPARGVDQQGRPHLDDDAREIFDFRRSGHRRKTEKGGTAALEEASRLGKFGSQSAQICHPRESGDPARRAPRLEVFSPVLQALRHTLDPRFRATVCRRLYRAEVW